MQGCKGRAWRLAAALLIWQFALRPLGAVENWWIVAPEQRHIEVRPPGAIYHRPIPEAGPPVTVRDRTRATGRIAITLDEAIRITLSNSDAIRVLAGDVAVSSGRTIYDPAITNVQIDQERARFDPTLEVINNFYRTEPPFAVFDPASPGGVGIRGFRNDNYLFNMGLAKTNQLGGVARLGVQANPTQSNAPGLPLNPQTPSNTELSYTQPLLQGAGRPANIAPIIIARINTERSFYQLKDTVQDLVQSVVQAYWGLVFARTDVWAREQQVEQGQQGLQRAEASKNAGVTSAADIAQARSALAGFRANLVTSEANLLAREAALRNIMGLIPASVDLYVPVSPPTFNRQEIQWPAVYELAAQQRPDIIELQLVLEADEQQLIRARNQALPRLDANALYRWNGLEGRTPDRTLVSNRPGEFTDWQLGVNFSVPLGLRRERATMRQQELFLVRDRANIDQQLQTVSFILNSGLRNLDQFWTQYESFRAVREASRVNLEIQFAQYIAGRNIYLNVLQAITEWGNSVSREADALTQYNTALATLERETGTILEVHGVRFAEERYGSIGPLGRLFHPRLYPKAMAPTGEEPRYPGGQQPAENTFDLRNPIERPPATGPDPYLEEPREPVRDVLPELAVPENLPAPPPQERPLQLPRPPLRP